MSTADENLVRSAWAAAVPADATPGRAWLAACRHWPPAGVGPDLPADAVRWLARERADDVGVSLPHGAAGALVYAWGLPPDPVLALRLVPLTAGGAAGPWFGRDRSTERSIGVTRFRLFTVRGSGPGDGIAIVTREIDALAALLLSGGAGIAMATDAPIDVTAAIVRDAIRVGIDTGHEQIRGAMHEQHGANVEPLRPRTTLDEHRALTVDTLAAIIDQYVADFASVEPESARLAAAWRAVLDLDEAECVAMDGGDSTDD